MFLEKIIIPVEPPEPITTQIAKEIYWYLKLYKWVSQAFTKASKYPFYYYEDVAKEIEAIESMITEEMNRPAEQPDPENPVELRPKNKAELLWRLNSDILDVEVVLNDYIDYVMVYKLNTTWTEFIEQFNSLI